EDEIKQELNKIITDEGISGKQEFGKLMKAATAALRGKADGKLISQIAKELL
ncbi:MAG: GatB/YqeY domain-containing protein, partial [Nitrospinae bacterium]|nr:GatB/YqeY domain-containing protein [Nitrospinota bacterium]